MTPFLAYINNIFDTQPKALTREGFNQLIDSETTRSNVQSYRATGDRSFKNKLPAVMFNGLYSPTLAEAHMRQPQNAKGKAPSMRDDECFVAWPMLGLDIDASSACSLTPRQQFESAWSKAKQLLGISPEEVIVLAYATPSSPGMRMVVKRTQDLTIEQEQERWNKVLPQKCDAKCKNLGRLYFLTAREDLLYLNEDLLFDIPPYNPADYPAHGAAPAAPCLQTADTVLNPTPADVAPTPTKTDAEMLENIVYELEQYVGGGAARQGDRNNQVYRLAALMKSLVGTNIPLLQTLIPTYNLSKEEHLQAIANGLKTTTPANMPQSLERAIARAASQKNTPTRVVPPPMPKRLPHAIEVLVSIVPEKTRAAAAMGSFAAWRAQMKGVSFQYIDNRSYEPAFFCICCAPQAEGKTAIRIPADCILESIREADQHNRKLEEEWREECRKLGSNKDKPKAPNVPIRIVEADMTNPALVWRAFKADGFPLYTYAEELEKLSKLSGLSEIIRCAYDSARYGQERVTPGAVSLVVENLRWNFSVATTAPILRKKFKNDVLNGTLTRLSLSTIQSDQNDFGDEMPVYGTCDDVYKAQLAPYIARLNQAVGLIDCPEAKAWANAERMRQIDELRAKDAPYMVPFMKRSLQMGFWRAMILYIMNGSVWSKDIERFASWSIDYDLWCKLYFFADIIEGCAGETPDNSRYTKRLTAFLPNEFTREQARNMRKDLGRSTTTRDVSNMLHQWTHRGLVVYDEKRGVYVKTHSEQWDKY